MKKDPIKITRKAGKRVGKALSTFERAASDLDRASAEHLAAVEKLDAEIEGRTSFAIERMEAQTNAAAEYVAKESVRIADEFAAELALVHTLCELAESTEDEAYIAQVQADNLRSLIDVA